ncbi:MAG: hypothetical protein M1608_11420 [Candidatus Omnitrophica bacterium]|nr:hypothetical protein [Candidatus Omnitrophota bacterium]
MQSESEETVICAKCKQPNDPGLERCVRCQGHLYVACRACGAKNQRVLTKCRSCGSALHRIKRKRKMKNLYVEGHVWRIIVVCILFVMGIIAWVVVRHYFFNRTV